MVLGSPRAVIRYITLPNQSLYDPDGTDRAPRLPVPVVATVEIKLGSQSELVTEFQWFVEMLGEAAILHAAKISSGSINCWARLEQVENVTEQPTYMTNRMVIRASFAPLTAWG